MAFVSSVLRSEEHPWLPEDHAPFAGKYTVERILGQGGMGTVFEARHIRLGQRVAIKVLGSALREYPELVQRFEREARACGSLSSAHAVRIFDIDATEDGTPFIVMELLAGRDLGQIVDREGPQPVSRAVRWVIEACDAIAEAHRLGIIHRDLKPSNLFLAESDGKSVVKVLDFGIAKRVASTDTAITQALCPLGTPQYMSPEQVRCAKDVDARSDVWSLGVSLYELVTGRTPFPDESASACIAAIAADPVPDPRSLRADLGHDFTEVLMRALAKSAKDRFQSIAELVTALAPFADAADDQQMVFALRDVITSSEPPAVTPIAMGESYHVRTFEARGPLESRSDRTVPPAVSIVRAPAGRRFRSSIAIGSAAALAMAAFTLLAPFGAATEGAARASVAAPAMAPLAAPTQEVSAVATAPATSPAPAVAEPTEPVAEPVAKKRTAPPTPAVVAAQSESLVTQATAKALVPRPLVAELASAAPDAKRPTSRTAHAPNDRPAPQTTTAHFVHGGLSNPGF